MTKRYLGMDEQIGEGESVIRLGSWSAGQTDHQLNGEESYLGPLTLSQDINKAMAANTAYVNPIAVPRPFSLTHLVLVVTGAFGGAGTEAKLAVWRDNGHGWPGVLVISGTKTISAVDTGVLTCAVGPILLEPGMYFSGIESKDAGLLVQGAYYAVGNMGWTKIANAMRPTSGFRGTIVYASFPPDPYSDTGNVGGHYTDIEPIAWLKGTFL